MYFTPLSLCNPPPKTGWPETLARANPRGSRLPHPAWHVQAAPCSAWLRGTPAGCAREGASAQSDAYRHFKRYFVTVLSGVSSGVWRPPDTSPTPRRAAGSAPGRDFLIRPLPAPRPIAGAL